MIDPGYLNLLIRQKSIGSALAFFLVFILDMAFFAAAMFRLIPVDMVVAVAVFFAGLAIAFLASVYISKRYRYIRGKAFIAYTYGIPGLAPVPDDGPLMDMLKKKAPAPESLMSHLSLASSPEEADTIVSVNWVPVNTGNYSLKVGNAETGQEAAKGYKVMARVTLLDMKASSPFYTAYNRTFDGSPLPQQVMFGLNDRIIMGEAPVEKIREFLDTTPRK